MVLIQQLLEVAYMRIIICCIVLILLFAGSASAQWTVEYEREKPDHYYGIAFPSASVGYIVGGGGSIMKTTDGGSTWVDQTSPIPDSFFDVFFKSETEGWIVGDNGVIVYTTDGGTNWIEHSQSRALTTADLNTVYFVDDYGWTGGDSEDIFRTTDGGTTWYLAEALISTMEVEGISFVDTLVGYAAVDGDGIIYSTDGGLNWTSAALNFGPAPYPSRKDIEAIFTVDDTLAVATGWGSMSGAQPTIILVSKDAGQTWNCPDYTYPWNSYAYGLGITKFDDGEIVIVGGGSGFAGLNIHGSADLTTWSRVQEFYGDYLRDCAAIPGTNTIMAVGYNGTVARSTDRGQTWSFNFDPSFGFAGIKAITKAGTTTLAVGTKGLFMKKEAAGDWVPSFASPNGYTPILKDVWYVGGVIYISGQYDYLAKSTDMGATWTQLSHSASLSDGIYSMHWFDALNGLLVGEYAGDDAIYTTNDGGVTRTLIWHDVKDYQFNSVHFAAGQSNQGVIGGDNIALYYTIDGGLTWTAGVEDVVSTGDDIEKVFMFDNMVAWGVGDNGTIVKSTDGGMNWFQQPTWTTTVELKDIEFNRLNGHGWIAGDINTARHSKDGGVTWIDLAIVIGPEPSNSANCVYLQNEAHKLYIGADHCMIQYWDSSPTGDTPMSLPFVLNQNYPNPFNPSTTISFTLDRDGFVSLNVYDVAGRVVATILNKAMTAGSYDVGFNASGLSSGVYFYKLNTADQVMTRKMILLR
jgi:photosystem II stability/assembly factor-like uncharacterized protein